MIPHDSTPKIPEFYLKELRALAASVAKQKRVLPEIAKELQQEAIVQFLSCVSVKQMANPVRENWDALYKTLAKALDHFAYEEVRGHMSLDENPHIMEAMEDTADDAPTWIPSDPQKRRELRRRAKELLRPRSVTPQRRHGVYQVRLQLLGSYVMICGDLRTPAEAIEARARVLQNIIDWCADDDGPGDSGDAAERFVALHVGPGAKPAPFYGDPLNVLVYLEDFSERVTFGHRYYVGDAGYERTRFAGSREG